jgi:hypothetical protein
VGVGLEKGSGEVCVGNMAAPSVTVGLNTAVIVKSGVGNTIGVGEETKGKLQAIESKTSNPIIKKSVRFCLTMLPS